MAAAHPTFPQDITALGRGRAQRAVLNRLHRTPTGTDAIIVTDLTRYPDFRRMHFAAVLSAIDALAKRGIVRKSHDDLGIPTVALVPHSHA